MERRIAKVLTTFGLAAGLAAAPFALQDGSVLWDGHQALAKSNGGQGGHGKGHGNGNGHGNNGNGNGHGHGHSKHHGLNQDGAEEDGYAGVGSKLKGAFNAVHASTNANPSPNSQVTAVRNYLDAAEAAGAEDAAVDEGAFDAAVEAAAEAAVEAAKGKAIDVGVLDAVHEIGDVEVDEPTTEAIAGAAAEIQDANLEGEDVDGEGEEVQVDGEI